MTDAIVPWLDNWIITRQLWQSGTQSPGSELNLIPAARNLTLRFRLNAGAIAATFTEFDFDSPIRVAIPSRGIVEIALRNNHWNRIRSDQTYTAEILAYGVLQDAFPFAVRLPDPHHEILGSELYAPPSQIVMTLGTIPGADVQTAIDLSNGWTLSAQGYWTKTIDRPIYGIWINGCQARSINRYEDLGTDSAMRSWVKIGNTVYVKTPDDLSSAIVETCHNAMVLRWLHEATIEIERRTGQFFNKRRVYRETHRGLRRQRQLFARTTPITIDRTFRLDCYSDTRSLYRRYTETAFDAGILHAEPESGAITVSQSLYDWWDWGDSASVGAGIGTFAHLPRGENNIEVTYVAGNDLIPIDIAQATAYLAAKKAALYWNAAISGGMSAISIGCVSLNFADLFSRWFPIWDAAIDSVIANYQRFSVEAF